MQVFHQHECPEEHLKVMWEIGNVLIAQDVGHLSSRVPPIIVTTLDLQKCPLWPIGDSSAATENDGDGRSIGERGESRKCTTGLRMRESRRAAVSQPRRMRARVGVRWVPVAVSGGQVNPGHRSLFVQVPLFSPFTTTLRVNKILKYLKMHFFIGIMFSLGLSFEERLTLPGRHGRNMNQIPEMFAYCWIQNFTSRTFS